MNILIVDDEPIIRKGLEKAIRQLEGFTVAGSADDGETALEWLEGAERLPDLIITDIFMQYIDGLELIEQVNRLYPGIKCTILSGHEEFHLAQKAIDLKVCRYITKPVEPSELYAVLDCIRTDIRKERLRRSDLLRLEQLTANASLYVRDKLLSDLLEGRLVSAAELHDFAGCFPFSLEEEFISGVMCVCKWDSGSSQRDMLLYSVAVKQLFLEAVLSHRKGFIMIKDTGTLVFGMQGDSRELETAADFCSLAESVLGIPVAVELGDPAKGLLQLASSLAGAFERLEARMNETFVYPFQEEQRLRVALRTGDTDGMHRVTADFAGRLLATGSGPDIALQGFYKLIVSVEQLLEELQVACPPSPRLSHLPFPSAVERIERWLDACLLARGALPSPSGSELVDKVAAYLEEHYAEASLTLQQLAELAGVHPNYLTQTFRKITGLSCMQYLARLRMEKAKALLHQTELKICDIAERVGYENPLYFSSYFKKWVGVNPSDYKDGMGTYA
ncbi:response regulator [Paenibacillus filicis]|uniref:Response regulator n=1 Tax=Paenibacillus gyeongsangnamensis TaxID=3388067 RepID=A0ABT4QJ86_9BACL|nr:response regulator [Paenibacillus filicis]MCZ8516941.1 response regulator [Paenibacillus filicis]